MKFSQFLKKLLRDPSKTTLKIMGKKRKVKAMAKYKTVNLGEDYYYKLVFNDGTFLLIVPSVKLVMFAEKAHMDIKEIPDKKVGAKQVKYKGKMYKLDNGNDYQYVVQLLAGKPGEVEGEVRFSDYSPVDGSPELLSLGWLTRTGERADINPREVNLEEVEIT